MKKNVGNKTAHKIKAHKKTEKGSPLTPNHWVFPKMDAFFDKRLNLFFYISLILTLIIGANLFELKISEGGDDSDYIVAAKHFLDGVSFPSWHGSLYPVFLSPFLALFGINLFIFKSLSFLCIIAHLIFFHKTFKKDIAPTFLVIIYLILSVNSQLLYYASQTYSEAFYLMLQMWLTMLILKTINTKDDNNFRLQLNNWKSWLVIGLATFAVVQTRNVGLAAIMSIVFVFAVNKKYIPALFGLGAFIAFSIPLRLYKIFSWHINQGAASQQFQKMFLKNPYNAGLGTEDFQGMLNRFVENFQIYLSKHIPIILGLKPESSTDKSFLLAILIGVILLASFILSYKKNTKIFFVATLTIAGIMATFISQQVFWGQLRLILIFVPFSLILLSWLVMELSKAKNMKSLKTVTLVFFLLVFFKTLGISYNKMEAHKEDLRKNMKGDLYAGYTTDWVNFLKTSKWAENHLPDSVKIASRKPSMSFIYGGSKGIEYFGIFRVPTYNAKDMLQTLNGKYKGAVAINLRQKSINKSTQTRFFLGRNSIGFIVNNKANYVLVDTKRFSKEAFFKQLNAQDIQYLPSIDSLNKKLGNSVTQYSALSSDSLLYKLYKNDVDYVIRGSLRKFPKKKTKQTINTVIRYLYFIELKYPGIFSMVHQEGKNKDEPAFLYKINYNNYKINDNTFKE